MQQRKLITIFSLLAVVLVTSCTSVQTDDIAVESAQTTTNCSDWFPGNDIASRVIYEETGKLIMPYWIPEGSYDPETNTYSVIHCIHMATGELRGAHYNVCGDIMPEYDRNPYTWEINSYFPFEGDTLWWPNWEENPFD